MERFPSAAHLASYAGRVSARACQRMPHAHGTSLWERESRRGRLFRQRTGKRGVGLALEAQIDCDTGSAEQALAEVESGEDFPNLVLAEEATA